MDDGVGSPRRIGWWPFLSGNGPNVRDDGSVDYASLKEDWASRLEENPHWWAQEGGGALYSTIQYSQFYKMSFGLHFEYSSIMQYEYYLCYYIQYAFEQGYILLIVVLDIYL
jgi:hypothetical protein